MEARRELLLKRRRNKKNQEIEQKRLEDKVKALDDQDKVEEEVTEQYVRDLLEDAVKANDEKLEVDIDNDGISRTDTMRRDALAEKDDAKKRKERFMNLLNEKMADGDQERYAGLLAKQFVEKDGNLKLLLQKYADDRLAETEAIKDKYRKDMEVLEDLKKQGQIKEE